VSLFTEDLLAEMIVEKLTVIVKSKLEGVDEVSE